MCARQSAHQKRNDYLNYFIFLYPRADRHRQVIAAEALMSYELGILPRCVGWFGLTPRGGIIDWRSCWHRLELVDAHALRRQDAWPDALHSEKP